MKKFVILTVALLAVSSASAQRIENFKNRLSEPMHNDSIGRVGKVAVREVGSAAEAVRESDAVQGATTVKGFRIVIFFDNSSTARANAEAAIMSFNALYPDVSSYLDYENPYFKVLVGGCVTSEEAIVLLGRITPNFPKAYITREEIKLTELAHPKFVAEPATQPSTEAIETPTEPSTKKNEHQN